MHSSSNTHGQRRAAYAAYARRRLTESGGADEEPPPPPRPLRAPSGAAPTAAPVTTATGEQPAEGMRRLRVTKFAVLLNTNVTAHNGGVVVELLEDYLKHELWVPATMVTLLPTRSGDPSHILQVDIQAPSIEIGPKQGRVHAHFIVKVRHCDSVLIAPVQGLMQRHVRANSVFYAAYVSVTLMDAMAENYALKEAYV